MPEYQVFRQFSALARPLECGTTRPARPFAPDETDWSFTAMLRMRRVVLGSAAMGLIAGMAVLSAGAQAQGQQPPAAPNVPVPVASSETARDVLARVRPAVIQIKGFLGTNTAQAFHGTGFAVLSGAQDGGGTFMTNYHVVAEHVQSPAKYRLEYRTPDGKTGPVAVLAVDVRHDLALVRAEGHAPSPLALVAKVPVKGERAYSVGFPLDVGLTITEGVSNGKVEDSFEPRIHYSGAINGGMSGGPALNASGEVIGVNVSGYRFEQLVSFLVPAEHAAALRAAAPAGKVDVAVLKRDIPAQVRAHSLALMSALDGPLPTQAVAGYRLPDRLAPFMDCNASARTTPEQPLQMVSIQCTAKASLYLGQGFNSGDLKYHHVVLSTTKLGAWRFAGKMSAITTASGERGNRRHVAPFACEDRTVGLKGFDASVVVCARSYRKLEGLYDFTVRVSSLNGTHHGFASHIDMFGQEFDAGMKFIQRYVEAMEWKP